MKLKRMMSLLMCLAMLASVVFSNPQALLTVQAAETGDEMQSESQETIDEKNTVTETEHIAFEETESVKEEGTSEAVIDDTSETEAEEVETEESAEEAADFSVNTRSATVTVSTFAVLESAISNAADGTETIIGVSSALTFTSTITIPAKKKITLQSVGGGEYGHKLTYTAGRHFEVEGSLTLKDVTLNGDNKGGGIDVKGALTMNSGTVIECAKANIGGGVYVSGTFTMNDGVIRNNSTGGTKPFGGGVHVEPDASFIMSGGEIYGNSATYGAGVDVDGSFTMTGGKIRENTASYAGGGVGAHDGTFTMKGGSINSNSAINGGGININDTSSMTGGSISNNDGAGVYIYSYGTFNMNGGTVSNNSGNGISTGGILNMNGGTISNNSSSGIYVDSGTCNINNGVITRNTASDGGGVFVSQGVLTMKGGSIDGNTATEAGGGIYMNATDTAFILKGGTITNNTAGSAGGVYIGYLYTITGGSVTSNNPDNIIYGTKAMNSSQISKATNLTAKAASASSIKISWTKADGITGYEIWYTTSENGTYEKLKATTGSSYTHTGLETGSTYYYKIRSYITVSDTKIYGSHTTPESKVMLQTPSNVKLTNSSATSLKVSWSKVADASGYEIYRATSKNGTYKNIKTITSGTTTSYTNKNLTNNKTYYYKVRAYKTVNETKKYGSYCSILSKKVVLAKPTLTAATKSKTSIKLSWTAVSGATKYEIYRATSKNGTYKKVATVRTLFYTNKKLKSNMTYYYKMKAVQGSYKSAYSEVKWAKTSK